MNTAPDIFNVKPTGIPTIIELEQTDSWLPMFPGFADTAFDPCFEEISEDVLHILSERMGYHFAEDWDSFETFEVLYNWNNSEYETAVAAAVTEAVEDEIQKVFGKCIRVEFQEVHNPKYYNFKNDSINVRYVYTSEFIEKLREWMASPSNWEHFKACCKESFTPRSGFIPFYSHSAHEWVENTKNFSSFDSTELGWILGSVLCGDIQCDDVGDDVALLCRIEEQASAARIESAELQLPEFSRLPEDVRNPLEKLIVLKARAVDDFETYIKKLPEYAGKARKDSGIFHTCLEKEYVETLVEYIQATDNPANPNVSTGNDYQYSLPTAWAPLPDSASKIRQTANPTEGK